MVNRKKNNFGGSFRGKPVNFFKTNSKDYPSNMFKDNDRDGVANAFDCKPNDPNKQGLIDAVVGAVKGIGHGGVKKGWREGMDKPGNAVTRAVKQRSYVRQQRRNEVFSQMGERQQQKIIKNRLRREGVKRVAGRVVSSATSYGYRKSVKTFKRLRDTPRQIRTGNVPRVIKQRQLVLKKSLQQVFPQIPSSAVKGVVGGEVGGKVGGKVGRPKGTLDSRYAAYGGVFGYRRYISQQRKQARLMFQQQQEMMRQQRIPQYEQVQQQQVQDLPIELQQQLQQMEQQQLPTPQVQQYQQSQVQVQEPQREIKTVFKSHGGSPYQPVDRTPLAPPQSTIPYGYVESVDAFTGRRYLKPLPKREGWTR